MTESEMTCRELVELLTEYFEDALPAPVLSRLEAHLATCGGCAEYTRQMRVTIGLSGRLRRDDFPADVRESLVTAYRSWAAGIGRSSRTADEYGAADADQEER